MKLGEPLFNTFVALWFSLERFELSKIVQSTSIEEGQNPQSTFISNPPQGVLLNHEDWNIAFQPYAEHQSLVFIPRATPYQR